MTAAIVRDAAIAVRRQKEHLVFDGIRAERPAVTENDWLPLAPVIVIDLRPSFVVIVGMTNSFAVANEYRGACAPILRRKGKCGNETPTGVWVITDRLLLGRNRADAITSVCETAKTKNGRDNPGH